ncbi:similar to Saccharomyces cerevisiae YDR322W MRPL35 Mitochondrial ribosomal protein of the large subunit [Maudiozyma barnettii]|uniref:Large ribosomal subunit protein mL38 n=1 Tax=Maudiozyma barnettii TaxID=61262 RepID=A0A8H2VDZ3_9SACH|nr:mitochondrial 54S ribosomal protein YmL35 [Kazachstania barnettii]CAB4253800.1 similar to Saccharomyces cerevisiae YDR322W MRPL35 Mitochondrial ribosomal protein of the large subunit [Kazachstania barnettii]CAD1781549.1 similar to Saccharomyces cerevisiae YDR322W MRPL35 Mitochondrial ribosomal protein of the large subunit [Kazachstania barnettii]
MYRRLIHTGNMNRSSAVWSDFTTRSKSLGISSVAIKEGVLHGDKVTGGPISLKRKTNRMKYNSPALIDETFKTCYEFLQDRSGATYKYASKETIKPASMEKLLVKAEITNPEVQYNFQFGDKLDNLPTMIDYNQPVYRHLGKKHWESYKLMLLMQRLESLKVIPDTLPTLKPRAAVDIKFPYSTGVNQWIEPGKFLSSGVTSLEPIFKIQEYELVNPKEQLYTILIVNPDEPDLMNNSFKTTLSYGLTNVKIDYNDNVVDSRKFFERNILANYLPPVPEKNAGIQRFAVWVFRQSLNEETGKCCALDTEAATPLIDRDNFDIRGFVQANQLDPIGAHVWRSKWDSNVNNIREQYNLPKGRVFSRVRV